MFTLPNNTNQLMRALLALLCCCWGCHTWSPSPRPTIGELFEQANRLTAEQPDPALDNAAVTVRDDVIETLPTPNEQLTTLQLPGPINEEFLETDIREAIQTLAQTANVTVIVDEKIRGTVNASLNKISFESALETILLPLGLVWSKQGDRYLVGTPEPDSALFALLAEHSEYQPLHRTTQEVVSSLPERLKRFVRIMDKTNLIMIDAPRPHTRLIRDRFTQVDQPIPQVILGAIVCVVSPDCGFKFGLDWNHAVPVNGTDAFSVGIENLGLRARYSARGGEQLFSDFAMTSAFVNLLAEHGYLAIRAAPRVMARDGEQATISINRETFFAAQPVAGNSANNANNFIFPQNIQKVDAGITLDIVPHIRGDLVTVKIDKAEVSEDIRTTGVDLSGNGYPVINRRSVSTTVHVHDGKTIVIGGLVQRQTVERINEIPGLSKLPLVGGLFQSIQRQERDAEVVIFISPRIVRNSGPQDAGPLRR